MNEQHFLVNLSERFPRLKEIDFTYSVNDRYTVETTPAGDVEALYFYNRQDFENAVIALAYKLEKRPIPKSMGAMFLSGLVDHVAMEKCSIVLLSRGGYSAVKAEDINSVTADYANITEDEWNDKSFTIRLNHELAHYVQRKLFPENKHALRDEIKADMVGLISAFGEYKAELARLFLGIEGEKYRNGGRLQNYVAEGESLPDLCDFANRYIDNICELTEGRSDAFECLIDIEEAEKNKLS